jgi:hypothetical protein
MREAGCAACIGEMRLGGRTSDGVPERRDRMEGLGMDARIILKLMQKKQVSWTCTGFVWLRVVARSGLL